MLATETSPRLENDRFDSPNERGSESRLRLAGPRETFEKNDASFLANHRSSLNAPFRAASRVAAVAGRARRFRV